MTDTPDSQDERDAWDLSDPKSVERLWNAYYERIRSAVRQRVRDIRRPAASESEVAESALRTFLRRAQEGLFPDLTDEDELWRLLKTIAIRKANDMRKRLLAQRRGGGNAVLNQVDLADPSTSGRQGLADAPAGEPAPSLDLEVSEMFNSLLAALPDDRHRDLILLKLQGASVAIIAEHLSTTTRTVQRMTNKIEQAWQSELLER